MSSEPLLVCKSIYKSFGPTKALTDVSITVERGQILGLIGENGSGKSTLTSIVAGIQPYDSGEMFIEGKEHKPHSSLDAEKNSVGMIVQEKGTVDNISIAADIFLGREKQFMIGPFFSSAKMNKAAQEHLDSLDLGFLSAKLNTSWINAEMRKLVEIARVMYTQPDILIIDETTTALSELGRSIIYSIMRKQIEQNKSVIFITHDLDELMEHCTDIIVLRDGVFIKQLKKEETNVIALRNLMVGRELSGAYYREDHECRYEDEVVLSMEHVSDSTIIEDFSIELHKGEILGIAGLSECGMHEVGRLAFGISKALTGKVINHLNNTLVKNPSIAKQGGIGYTSKNRDAEAIINQASIQDNILMPSYDKIAKGFYISGKAERIFAEAEAEKLRLKCRNIKQRVDELSGGNKQKVVFAKWIGYGADIIIMDCPTRGIDVGVKANMYQLMEEFKNMGKSIILISEEMAEVIGMADRILVMKDGKITTEVRRDELPNEKLLVQHMI